MKFPLKLSYNADNDSTQLVLNCLHILNPSSAGAATKHKDDHKSHELVNKLDNEKKIANTKTSLSLFSRLNTLAYATLAG